MSNGIQMRIRIPPDLEEAFVKELKKAEEASGVSLTNPQFVVAIIKRHLSKNP